MDNKTLEIMKNPAQRARVHSRKDAGKQFDRQSN